MTDTQIIQGSVFDFLKDLEIDGQRFERPLIIYDKNVVKLIDETISVDTLDSVNENAIFLENGETFYTDLKNDFDLKSGIFENEFDCIIGFGGGSVIDKAKIVSVLPKEKQIPCVAIPSILSTYAFNTCYSKVSELIDIRVDYPNPLFGSRIFESKIPDYTLIDVELLDKEPELSLLGLVSILAIQTAQIDWVLADCCNTNDDDYIDHEIYERACDVCDMAKVFINEKVKIYNVVGKIKNLDYLRIANILIEGAKLANESIRKYENLRIVTGAETLIADALIPLFPNTPYSVAVAVGMMVSSFLQIRYMGNGHFMYICNYLKDLGMFQLIPKYFWEKAQIIDNLITRIEPSDKLFTVLNLQPILGGLAESILIASESIWVPIKNYEDLWV